MKLLGTSDRGEVWKGVEAMSWALERCQWMANFVVSDMPWVPAP
jgi:hypothetical protein